MDMGPLQDDPQRGITGQTFSVNSGSNLERLIFSNRPLLLLLYFVFTVLLGLSALHLRMQASFEKIIPTYHPFIVNYEHHKADLGNLSGNTVNVVVESNHGGVFNKEYLAALEHINDQVFLLPGVNRAFMRSLWTPAVRWTAVTSQGLVGGAVMPVNYDGSAATIATLAGNVQNAGIIGDLVASDFQSTNIQVPLLDIDQDTGKPLDYNTLARKLDHIRKEFNSQGVTVHITGFAMIVGDLIKGMTQILGFFAVSIVISSLMVFLYTRCIRSTLLMVFCSLLAVIWQLGILPLIGFELDPYSILVPFLVFAIGMSHGAQKMNGVMQDIGRGSTSLVAARMTFRRLFIAGFTALVCDAVGFAVLMTIRISAIQHLAILASIGVAILILTNLILLPVLLSYVGVSPKAAARSLLAETGANLGHAKHPIWSTLDLFTQRRYAAIAIIGAVVLGAFGLYVGRDLQTGDINPGAPELRADSVYNLDNAYYVSHYASSSDVFVVMISTPFQQCSAYSTLALMDDLETRLRQTPGVLSTSAFPDFERIVSVGLNEGNFDWYDLIPNQPALDEAEPTAPLGMHNEQCNFLTLSAFLQDHKASTLQRVTAVAESFARAHSGNGVSFQLAAGNAGIAAATNIVVSAASRRMLIEVYLAVICLSMITFRSWRAVIAAILPLVLTSILAQALMVKLGIGIKVATLPVTALGVGIGVDYALYILSVTLANMRAGLDLSEAYYRALLFTGKVVMLSGFTLAVAVGTWAFSSIKFQADMGELLAFMFLWNMFGALVLLPALCSFLLPANVKGAGQNTSPHSLAPPA